MALGGFVFPSTAEGLIVLIIELVILWVIVSIPVYVAGKLITAGRAGFGEAMSATLGGGLIYLLVLFGVSFFLGAILGSAALVLGFILALICWLAVYRASFNTGWLEALGIVVLAWFVLIILDVILGSLFGVNFPKFYPF